MSEADATSSAGQEPAPSDTPADGTRPAGTPQPPRAPSVDPEPTERGTVADAVADLIRLFVEYVRQETDDLVHDKVVLPTQQAGQVVAFALAAAMVLFLGIAFISVAALMLLAEYVGWPAALAIVGTIHVLGASGLTYAKMKKVQT